MTHKVYGTIVALIGVVFFMSCSNIDNPDLLQENNRMPLIILDTDIGSSTDDTLVTVMCPSDWFVKASTTPKCG